MLEVKNIEVFGLERAQRAIKNSYIVGEINTTEGDIPKANIPLGSNMDTHQSHDAFLKGIVVYFDIKLNMCVQPEFQRYHFIEFIMQQSRMHSIDKMMKDGFDPFTKYVDEETREHIDRLYHKYAIAKAEGTKQEKYESYMKLIHNLPCGIELWSTCKTNYLQLKTMVIQRFHHKQIEDWKSFVEMCFNLPMFRELCGFTDDKWNLDNW